MEYLKYILPVYLIVFYGAAVFWRSFQLWKRTGINPLVLDKGNSVQCFAGRVYRLISGIIPLIVAIYLISDHWYQCLIPIAWLEQITLKITGLVLLTLALMLIIVAQVQMGNSWRIGIDENAKTDLVQQEIFKFSRNPIFLGMRITFLGLFLILPNAATLVILVLGDVLLQIQVRLEEEYLTKTHSENYLAYCQRVRRWI